MGLVGDDAHTAFDLIDLAFVPAGAGGLGKQQQVLSLLHRLHPLAHHVERW